MFLGYNTNGFAHHRLEDAIEILADLGYQGIALTLDIHHLNPFEADLARRVAAVARQLDRYGLHCVVETGARFLLNPRLKHQPTLLSPTAREQQIRIDFLKQCVEIAADLGSRCISFWSGAAADSASREILMERLVAGCTTIADYAQSRSVRVAFEPEPGMLIDNMDGYAELERRVNHAAFGLTIDIGHLVCQQELPVSQHLQRWSHRLWNVHIEDMQPGVHDHRMFGEGCVDFSDVFRGLKAAHYEAGVYVELSRHSHDAVQTARSSLSFLKNYC